MDELIRRRSVRQFNLTKEVPDDILNDIILTSMQAPSAKNQKPWEYIVIKSRETIDQLSTISNGAKILINCNCVIALVMRREELLLSKEMAPQDLSCAMTYMMLKATSYNLGTCYIGVYPIASRVFMANNILNINDGSNCFALLAIGYPLNKSFKELKDRYELIRIHKERY